jgi:hypothetical protein
MHDSGNDIHQLPSYQKNRDPKKDSKSDVNAESTVSSLKNNLYTGGTMPVGIDIPCEPEAHIASRSDYVRFVRNVSFSKCSQCGKYAVWVRDKLVYPVIE